MKKIRLIILFACSIIMTIVLLEGCKKEQNKTLLSPPPPSIISLSTKSDTIGAQIVITGANFSTTASLDIVKFGTVISNVTAATSTQLTTTVPLGAQSGPITVTVNGQSVTSIDSFSLLGPTITGFSPLLAGIAYPVTLTGVNFSLNISDNIVTVNGVPATVSSVSATKLTIIVPDNAASGKIVVNVKGQPVTSSSDLLIKKLVVTTLAGTGASGNTDGPGAQASFSQAWGIIPDGNGNYFVADPGNHKIRKVATDGTVSTFSGTGIYGFKNGSLDTATYGMPYGVAFDKAGNMYVSDLAMNNIRMISTNGFVSTFAGDIYGNAGSTDGTGNAARFSAPLGIAVDANGNVFVVDAQTAKIRKITPGGVVTTLAGSGIFGSIDGNGANASFKNPYAIAIDSSDNLYVTESGGKKVRKITQAGDVTTIAGNDSSGSADGQGTLATFNGPAGIAIDVLGNIYVTDNTNGRIRIITPSGYVATLAGNGDKNSVDGTGNHASFSNPLGIAVDANGVLVVVDNGTQKIRKIVVQ